jgi:hypothetical protein
MSSITSSDCHVCALTGGVPEGTCISSFEIWNWVVLGYMSSGGGCSVVSRLSPHVPAQVFEGPGFPHESWLVLAYAIPFIWDIPYITSTVWPVEGCTYSRSDWVRVCIPSFFLPVCPHHGVIKVKAWWESCKGLQKVKTPEVQKHLSTSFTLCYNTCCPSVRCRQRLELCDNHLFCSFHTYDYARHFVSACTRILGLEGTPEGVEDHGKLTRVSAVHSLLPSITKRDEFWGKEMEKQAAVCLRMDLPDRLC